MDGNLIATALMGWFSAPAATVTVHTAQSNADVCPLVCHAASGFPQAKVPTMVAFLFSFVGQLQGSSNMALNLVWLTLVFPRDSWTVAMLVVTISPLDGMELQV
ncbi:hypothetical protein Vretimale_8425 [Volvox reticuliferus]|uniref:Uncharacterized protein n=1 Tax=Volvox reticuliferus TaxID=1737510 RepID=A0A8J4LNP4_9CHLO|nr:hypothetical protein Vretifemale_11824 [Volvox reticuliferus]GIM03756.1 hypothetical protein Vretimale_8425 [Volvox reticuliferus]